MDYGSTIKERWRLCILASFTGCITLLFCLNYGQYSMSLPTLGNIPVPANSSQEFPKSDTQFANIPVPANSWQEFPKSDTQFSNIPVPANSWQEFPKSDTQFSNIPVPANSSQEFPKSDTQFANIPVPANSSQEFLKNDTQFSTSPNFTENGGLIEIEKVEKCNLFDGRWIYNPRESPAYSARQCPFLSEQVSCQKNGRLDFEYEKWSWEAKKCSIPRFNGTDMLEKLKGKRLIIIGDSLNRNQWESLACLLYSSVRPSQAHVDVKSGVFKVFRAKDYNCSVEFYWSPFIVPLEVNKKTGKRILVLDKLPSTALTWQGADIMVFNTGHWWVHNGKLKAWDLFQRDGKLVENMKIELAFEIALKTWTRWIHENVNLNKTKIYFRSISPEHKGKHWCFNQTKPILDESYEPAFPQSMIEIVERTIGSMGSSIRYLNITKLSQYRRDAHPAVYRTKQGKIMLARQKNGPISHGDCSHWCLPGLPDTWNRLLYALMFFDESKEMSTSKFV